MCARACAIVDACVFFVVSAYRAHHGTRRVWIKCLCVHFLRKLKVDNPRSNPALSQQVFTVCTSYQTCVSRVSRNAVTSLMVQQGKANCLRNFSALKNKSMICYSAMDTLSVTYLGARFFFASTGVRLMEEGDLPDVDPANKSLLELDWTCFTCLKETNGCSASVCQSCGRARGILVSLFVQRVFVYSYSFKFASI